MTLRLILRSGFLLSVMNTELHGVFERKGEEPISMPQLNGKKEREVEEKSPLV